MIVPGNTFLIPSGKEGYHLFFVVAGGIILPEHGRNPLFILAGATTLHENVPHDPACVLESGEHSFIKKKSYIAYRYTRIETARHIEQAAQTTWKPHHDCSPAILKRIVTGISKSSSTPRYIKAALKSHLSSAL